MAHILVNRPNYGPTDPDAVVFAVTVESVASYINDSDGAGTWESLSERERWAVIYRVFEACLALVYDGGALDAYRDVLGERGAEEEEGEEEKEEA